MGVCPKALYQNLLRDVELCVGKDIASYLEVTTSPAPDLTTKEYACYSLMKALLKKLQVANSSSQDSKALLKFLTINDNCGKWKPVFRDEWDYVLFGTLKSVIYDFFHHQGEPIGSDLSEILSYGRVGPGAAIGSKGGDFYTKMFASPLTTTKRGLYLAYKGYVRNFAEWSNAENIRQQHFGEAHIVEGNRISFVPKNDEISRTICIEPSLNMFFQLGFGHIIERRLLSSYGISMADQPFKNRELARRGSVGLGLITCDLSSASDSMSLPMLKEVLPKYVYDMLRLLRSDRCDIPGLGYVDLNMVSTMGNGFTFPLQTMLFSAVVLTAMSCRSVKVLYPRGREFGNWGVFGDDIICPDSVWPDVNRLLRLLGFQINQDKTFVEGPFRESCGSDYYNGLNVRGVYVKTLRTEQDILAVINQLNLFSTRTGIRLSSSVQYLLRFVRWTPCPRWENMISGIHVPFSLVRDSLPLSKDTGSVVYRRYEPVGRKIRIGESSIWTPRGSKPRIYNPSGLLLAFLQRSINSYTIGVRHDRVKYKRKLGIAPSWDAIPTVHPYSGWFPWQRWDTAVYLNLYG